MDIKVFLMIMVSMVFINNFILSKFLGLCPFLGVSRHIKPALSMGMAVIFVMSLSSIITWLVYRWVLLPLNICYLRTITFILVIAGFVQFVEMFILKKSPTLYRVLGIYLPLITTNCAVLGVTVLNINNFFRNNKPLDFSFLCSLSQGFFAGVGFTLALLIMSGIRERLMLNDTPECFKDLPIAFIVASILSLGFMGFGGFRF